MLGFQGFDVYPLTTSRYTDGSELRDRLSHWLTYWPRPAISRVPFATKNCDCSQDLPRHRRDFPFKQNNPSGRQQEQTELCEVFQIICDPIVGLDLHSGTEDGSEQCYRELSRGISMVQADILHCIPTTITRWPEYCHHVITFTTLRSFNIEKW